MKLRLTIDLDVGDLMDKWRDEEIRQVLYDEVIRMIYLKHAEQFADNILSNNAMTTLEGFAIIQAANKHHEEWKKITYRPDWKFKKL